MSGSFIRDALDDVAAVLDGPKDAARRLMDLCDVEVDDWLTEPGLRRLGLVGLDGERPEVLGVELRAISGQLSFVVIIAPAPGTWSFWFEHDVMVELGPVAVRGGELLVELF